MFYEVEGNAHGLPNDPFKALVAPRPVAWVSSLSGNGTANLAPHSYFNAVSDNPHYLVFGSTGRKDSLRNVEQTGEFAINLATWELREAMDATSARVPPEIDEFELAGLAKAECRLIRPPRVAASPACFECKLFQIVPLPGRTEPTVNFAVIGRVVGIHIDERFIVDGRVDTAAMKPIARMGYSEYATVTEAWRMRRPD
jgi:flavin reductase (DIM6/NTAB) family NADH-FMN oxidoreductase RutF